MIWWWQFGSSDGCVPESTTILGWDGETKAIHEDELSKT